MDVTKMFDDVVFAHSFEAANAAAYGVAVDTLVLFRTFEEPQLNYAGEFTADAVKAWIGSNSLPTVMDFDQPAAQKIFGENLPALFLLVADNDASKTAKEALNAASGELKGKILMSATQVADGLGKRLGDYIGVVDADTPCVRIVNPTKEGAVNKYVYSGDITSEGLVKFYADFAAGTLSPVYKSEDVPETQDKAVFKLVGKQFKEVVMDSTKDVLVEYFAPWCGHCKSLAPIYEELATKLKNNANIVIAAMDATANEAEGVNVEGFPTIKFYPANNKEGVDYKGGRTLEDMLKYLKENATVQWVEDAVEGENKEDL
jgi:protein disulfide-isomerase A1